MCVAMSHATRTPQPGGLNHYTGCRYPRCMIKWSPAICRSVCGRLLWFVAIGWVAAAMGCVGDAVTVTRSLLQMPDSWDKTVGYLDWASSDVPEAEIQANASNYSFVWSGGQPSVFRTANASINLGSYMPGFYDDHNGRPEAFPEGPSQDTPERRERTLRWWNTEVDGVGHPDWVLYQCDGTTPAYYVEDGRTLPNMPLDITNPSVIDWQFRSAGAIRDGDLGFNVVSADVVFLMNIQHACGIHRDGQWVQLFDGRESDPAYKSAVVGWAQRFRASLHGLPVPRALVANSSLDVSNSDEEIARLSAQLDGVLDEQGFTGFGGGRIFASGESWFHKVRSMIAIQNQGVSLFSANYVSTLPPPPEDVEWILGSFLMARGHAAYILINRSYPGNALWPHLPQYDEDVGHPCAPMRLYQNVYVRDYSKGMSVVNPSSSDTFTVTLPPEILRDVYGRPIEGNELTLPPATGKVLLSQSSRCP